MIMLIHDTDREKFKKSDDFFFPLSKSHHHTAFLGFHFVIEKKTKTK